MTLPGGLRRALGAAPTGWLDGVMSGLQAKGPSPVPQCQQSLWADGNLGHPGARQGTCNNSVGAQSRQAYTQTHTGLVIGPHEHHPAPPLTLVLL